MSAVRSITAHAESWKGRHIVGTFTTGLLCSLLTGEWNWHQALRAAPRSAYTGRAIGSLPHDTLFGFVPHAEFPDEILMTIAPLRGTMIPVAALTHRMERWSAAPLIVKTNWLLEREVVEIERTDWIAALVTLAAELRVRGDWKTLDFTPWTIAAAWPDWEAGELSWTERGDDLAERLGTVPLSRNSLMVKCRRMGLTRK